jgi:hypothetical protein
MRVINSYPQQFTERKKEAKKERGTAEDGPIPSVTFLDELTRLKDNCASEEY